MKNYKNILRSLKGHWLFLIILLLVFGWSIFSYVTKGIVYSIIQTDIESVAEFISSFGIIASIIFLALVIVEVVVAPIPALVLYLAGGYLFGWFLGGTLAVLGNLIGATIDFEIARKYGRRFFMKYIKPKQRKRFDKYAKNHGGLTIFLLRINPFTSSDIFSYLAGLTNMSRLSLILGTLFGLTPLIYIQAFIGGDFIKDNPSLSLIFLIVSFIYFALFVYLIWMVFAKRKNKI